MKFHKKTISNAQTLGERLRRARRRKKLSLEKVETLTKIRARYLESLEKEEFRRLPSDVYVRGFLTTYANLLGLDVGEILVLYKKEKSIKKPHQPQQIQFTQQIKMPRFVFTPRIFLFLFGILLFLGLGGYFWYQVTGFAAAPKLIIQEPNSLETSVDQDSIIIIGNTDSGVSVNINDQPIGIDLDGNFRENIKLKKGLNQIKVVAKNKVGKETKQELAILANIPEIALKPNIAGQKRNSEIITKLKLSVICGPNAAWILVKVDGKEVYRGIMLPKTSQEFEANNEIIFTSGNAGSTHLILSGHDLGILGDEAEIKKDLKFDKTYLDQLNQNTNVP